MEICKIERDTEKAKVARMILESLADWFGIPEAREESMPNLYYGDLTGHTIFRKFGYVTYSSVPKFLDRLESFLFL